MPTLHLSINTQVSALVQNELAKGLTQITAQVLLKKHELTALRISTPTNTTWWIGAQTVVAPDEITAYFEIDISQGTNTENQKANYLAKVFAYLQSQLGPLAPASYGIVRELPLTDWGYGGMTQKQRQAAPSPGPSL